MSRLVSPAIGCHLRLVEVQVGNGVETYDATTFDQPLELSLEGQRSLGSELGILLLIISTGSKQMLSIRLNDLLSHPEGADDIISIDKQTYKLCVKLPTLDHILCVWFRHGRDFLVSVCILRKAGFLIEEGLYPGTGEVQTISSLTPKPTKTVDLPRLSTITPLAALKKQARISNAQCSSSSKDAGTAGGNIFDEVLHRLSKTDKKLDPAIDEGSSERARPEGSTDLSLLNPYNVLAAGREDLMNRPHISSPLRETSIHEHSKDRVSSKAGTNSEAKPALQPPRRHHGYFTRSFSLAARRPDIDVNGGEPARSSRGHGPNRKPAQTDRPRSPLNKASHSFDSSPTMDFRSLMPHRRSLPFLEAKPRSPKRLKLDASSESVAPNTSLDASPGTGLPVNRITEMNMLLMQSSNLDELETKSSPIYEQYEQDAAKYREDGKRAAFYLELLKNMRIAFWLDKLQKASASEHEMWVDL